MKIAPGPARRAESRGKDRSTLMLSTPPPEGRELLELRDTGLARQYHQERMASAVYLLLQVAAMIGRAHILQPGCSGHPVRAAPAAIGRKRACKAQTTAVAKMRISCSLRTVVLANRQDDEEGKLSLPARQA